VEHVVDVPVAGDVLDDGDDEVVGHLGGDLELGDAAGGDPARVRHGPGRDDLAGALEHVGELADGEAVVVGVGDVDVAVQGDALPAHALEGHAVQRRLRLGQVRDLLRHEVLGLAHQARLRRTTLLLLHLGLWMVCEVVMMSRGEERKGRRLYISINGHPRAGQSRVEPQQSNAARFPGTGGAAFFFFLSFGQHPPCRRISLIFLPPPPPPGTASHKDGPKVASWAAPSLAHLNEAHRT
jgi:hypothetical protein